MATYSRSLLYGLASPSRDDVFEALEGLASIRTQLETGLSFEDRMEAMMRLASVLSHVANDDAEVLDLARSLMVSLLVQSKGSIARTVPETLHTLLEAITQRVPVQRLSPENMRIVCFTTLLVLLECSPLAPSDPFVVHLHGYLHSQLWPYVTALKDTPTVIKEWQLTDADDVRLVSKALALQHPTISPLVSQIWSMLFVSLIVAGGALALVASVFCDPWHQGYVITGTGLIVLGYHCLSKVLREQNRRGALARRLAERGAALFDGPVTLVPPLSPILVEAVMEEPSEAPAVDDASEPAMTAPLPLDSVPEDASAPSEGPSMAPSMAELMDQMKPREMYETLERLNTMLNDTPNDEVSSETKQKVAQSLALLQAMQGREPEVVE
ncbi:hypothetical protein ACHHYP_07770 [Achlya hypogyna]|uniref:Transmembrane protein n=1 Tax=Achlya hypogyna TaxID=1202772 RepID=A0A1V9YQD2_ACHHY|nr:hypothetical protein ACHHYP_07770 [Achlya hypogyna]